MRYKFFREHKFVSYMLNELEREVATADFRKESDIEKIQKDFETLSQILKTQAQNKNRAVLELLRKKNSQLRQQVENEQSQLETLLNQVKQNKNLEEKIELGHQFYLAYRKFVGDNLMLLNEDETVIQLYSDKELKEAEIKNYANMNPKQLTQMVENLLPHLNPSEQEALLTDIKEASPTKFEQVWGHVRAQLTSENREYLTKKFALDESENVFMPSFKLYYQWELSSQKTPPHLPKAHPQRVSNFKTED